jgi:hypothetical protein
MQSIKVKTITGKTAEITTDELLTQFLHFCRAHFAEHSSEILLGENAKKNPEFVITPYKRNQNEN